MKFMEETVEIAIQESKAWDKIVYLRYIDDDQFQELKELADGYTDYYGDEEDGTYTFEFWGLLGEEADEDEDEDKLAWVVHLHGVRL